MKLGSPSDCFDIEGNKSILTWWGKPEQQEETTKCAGRYGTTLKFVVKLEQKV
jgi:hypothetical protein